MFKGFGLKLAKLRLKTSFKNQAKFRKGEPNSAKKVFGWITKEWDGLGRYWEKGQIEQNIYKKKKSRF